MSLAISLIPLTRSAAAENSGKASSEPVEDTCKSYLPGAKVNASIVYDSTAYCLATYSPDKRNKKLLLFQTSRTDKSITTKYDLTDSRYGAGIYGKPVIDVDSYGRYLTVWFERGGDGDHTVGRAYLYEISKSGLRYIRNISINSISFSTHDDRYFINGNEIYSSCENCDSYETADPIDLYIIPVSWELENGKASRKISLSETEISKIKNRAVEASLTRFYDNCDKKYIELKDILSNN